MEHTISTLITVAVLVSDENEKKAGEVHFQSSLCIDLKVTETFQNGVFYIV